jgi:hypothetical protein
MLQAHAHKRTILVYKCVKICIEFLWTRTQSEWKKFNLPKWKWARLLLAADTSLVRVSEWQTKGDATPSRWNAPHIVALLPCSGDAGVVLLIETSSQIHRGHCNWLRRGVHSRCIEIGVSVCLAKSEKCPADGLNLRTVHAGSVGHQTAYSKITERFFSPQVKTTGARKLNVWEIGLLQRFRASPAFGNYSPGIISGLSTVLKEFIKLLDFSNWMPIQCF